MTKPLSFLEGKTLNLEEKMPKIAFTPEQHLNRIVARRDKARKFLGKDGTLVAPDQSIEFNVRCTVIAAGPDAVKAGFPVGTRCIILPNAGRELHDDEAGVEDGQAYVFTSPENIHAILAEGC